MHRFAPRILLPLYTAAVIHCVCSALAGLYRLPSEIDYLLENIDLMYFLRELRMRNRTLKSLRKKGLEWLVSPCFGLLCMMLWYNYKLQWHTTALISRSFLVSEGQCSMGECHRARTLQPFTAWLEQRSSKSLWCETRNNCCWVPPSCWHRASFFFPLISSGYSCFYELGHQFSYSPESPNHYISIFLWFYDSPLFLALRADNTLLWSALQVWEPQNPLAQNLHLCKVLALSSVIFWHSRAVPIQKLSHHQLEAFDKGVSTALLQNCVTQPNFGVLSKERRKAQPLHTSSSWEMRRCEFPAWRFSKEKVTRIC